MKSEAVSSEQKSNKPMQQKRASKLRGFGLSIAKKLAEKTYQILQHMKRKNGTQPKLNRLEIPASWPDHSHTITSTANLEDPKQCTNWRTILDPVAIEYYLLLRNRLHFGQAQGTPFTEEPLSSDINWPADTLQSEEILGGTYTTQSEVPQLRMLLLPAKQQRNWM